MVKLYQTPNLLKFVKSVHGPTPYSSDYSVDNLTTNFDNRANIYGRKPIIDIDGNTASYRSCFTTSKTLIDDHSDGMAVLRFEFDEAYMIHGLLLV